MSAETDARASAATGAAASNAGLRPDPATPAAPPTDTHASPAPPARRPLPKWLLGVLALVLSLLGVLAVVIALSLAAPASATEQTWILARVLAGVANVVTVVGAISGLVAVVLGRGRRWGIAAVIVGVLGNPWLQVTVLSALS